MVFIFRKFIFLCKSSEQRNVTTDIVAGERQGDDDPICPNLEWIQQLSTTMPSVTVFEQFDRSPAIATNARSNSWSTFTLMLATSCGLALCTLGSQIWMKMRMRGLPSPGNSPAMPERTRSMSW